MKFKFRSAYYKILYGVRNLIAYAPVIWKDRDWDWACLLYLLEFKLRRMSAHTIKYDRHVGAERNAKNQLVAAELCKRIAADDYVSENYLELNDEDRRRDLKKAQIREAQDTNYLFNLLSKNLKCWWN